MRTRWREEDGAASSSWLLQLLLVLALLGVAGYETIAVGLTHLSVDDGSRQVARVARDAYRGAGGSLDAASDAAVEAARTHEANVLDVAIDGEDLTVTLRRHAPTLVLHRVGPLDDLVTREATARAPLG